MKLKTILASLVLSVATCAPTYGFEWLDRMLGIDLDNSQGSGFGSAYSADYAPYDAGYGSGYYNAGYSSYSYGYSPYSAGYGQYNTSYAPYTTSYAPNYSPSCNCAPQSSYRPVYQSAPATTYQPAPVTTYQSAPATTVQPAANCPTCGNQTSSMRPPVTYQPQPQVVRYSGN